VQKFKNKILGMCCENYKVKIEVLNLLPKPLLSLFSENSINTALFTKKLQIQIYISNVILWGRQPIQTNFQNSKTNVSLRRTNSIGS